MILDHTDRLLEAAQAVPRPRHSRVRHFAREVAHCFPACIIVHLLMEVLL